MHTINSYQVPKPTQWQDFEEIVLSAMKIKFNNDDFTKNGRQGQEQNGVDLYLDDNDKIIGVQCKLTNKLTINIINKEIKKAEKFTPPLKKLYICTTSERDAKLQCHLMNFKGKFKIHLMFWDDIIRELYTNNEIFNRHFGFIMHKLSPEINFTNDFKLIFKYIIDVDPYNEAVQIKALEIAENLINKWKMPDLYSKNEEFKKIQKLLINKVDDWINKIPCKYFKNLDNEIIFRDDRFLDIIKKLEPEMKKIRQEVYDNYNEIINLKLVK